MAVEAKAGTAAHSLAQAMDHARDGCAWIWREASLNSWMRDVMSPSASTLSFKTSSWRYGHQQPREEVSGFT